MQAWVAAHIAGLRGVDLPSSASGFENWRLRPTTDSHESASPPKYPSGMAELQARRERAADRLQRAASALLARRARAAEAVRAAAAVRIQALFRGNASRALAARARTEAAERSERDAQAAVRISAVRQLQAFWRGASARAMVEGARRARAVESAACRIVAGARGRGVRLALHARRMHAAAATVQAVVRANAERAVLRRLAAEGQQRLAAAKAATMLRSAARVHLGRRAAARLRSALLVQRLWRRRQAVRSISRAAAVRAAMLVQTTWRGLVARSAVLRLAAQERDAAEEQALKIERANAALASRQRAAATIIQAVARRRQARACTRLMRERAERLARIKLRTCRFALCAWRAVVLSHAASRSAMAAKLQAVWRGNTTRATLARARATLCSSSVLSSAVGHQPELPLSSSRPVRSSRHAAASTVQARFRGNAARATLLRALQARELSSISTIGCSSSPLAGLPSAATLHTPAADGPSDEFAESPLQRAKVSRSVAPAVAAEGTPTENSEREQKAQRVRALLAALRMASEWER